MTNLILLLLFIYLFIYFYLEWIGKFFHLNILKAKMSNNKALVKWNISEIKDKNFS